MSLSAEDIYNALIKAGLKEEDIQEEIKKKADEYQGYISESGILFLIAKNKNLAITQELYKELDDLIDYDEFVISVSEVRENMINIALLGKISKSYGIKEFSHKDGTPGKVGSFLLYDGTGQIKVVLWDENTKVMESDFFRVNELLRVLNGYVKKNKNNNNEVHVEKKGRVILAPDDVELRRFPLLQEITFYESEERKYMTEEFINNIQGTVVKIEKFEEKDLKDGNKTFLLKFILALDSFTVHVIVRGMQAVECLKLIDEGLSIRLSNMKAKTNIYTKMKELYFTSKSQCKIL